MDRLVPRVIAGVLTAGLIAACTDATGSRPTRVEHSTPLVDVALPTHADEPLVIRDERSYIELSATLLGAKNSTAEQRGDSVVYRDVFPGAELHYRLIRDGVEDLVVFTRAPVAATVSYVFELSPLAHALRLVENTLEVLDVAGAPRLRVEPPFVIDATGARHPAELRVEGCAVDTNPAAPWGRPVTELDASQCVLRVSWSNEIPYPAVLDPRWTATGSMTIARSDHSAVPVVVAGNPMVLVAGGRTYDISPYYTVTPSAELYDPVSRTFGVTGAMNQRRHSFPVSALADGSVLVAGGLDLNLSASANVPLRSSETYDPDTGTWALTEDGAGNVTEMMEARIGHTSTALADGRVLVTGGSDIGTTSASSEIFDPAKGTWAYTTDAALTQTGMSTPRRGHTATLLPDDTVLVAGGYSGTSDLSSAEVYIPVLGQWSSTGSMLRASSAHTATLLGNVVLINGGSSGTQSELYDVLAGTWRNTSGAALHSRYGHTATLLAPGGPVLVVGGDGEIDPVFRLYLPLDSAELYVPALDAWQYTTDLPTRCSAHAAVSLGSGRVLVTGGETFYTDMGPEISRAGFEIDGVLCATDADCPSGQGCSAHGICALSNGSPCSSQAPSQCLSGICARQTTGLRCSPCPTCQELDGSGATCVPTAAGTPCYPALTCANAVETRRACDGTGTCVATSTPCPGNLGCNGFASCFTSCASDSGCRTGYVCDVALGQCVVARLEGEPCDAAWQCASWVRNCVWSGSEYACAPCAVCSELDSTGSNCIRTPAGVACGPPSCQGDVQTVSTCDGNAACVSTSSACAEGSTCDGVSGSCMPLVDAAPPDGATTVDAAIADAQLPEAAATSDAGEIRDANIDDARGVADVANPIEAAYDAPTDAGAVQSDAMIFDARSSADASSAIADAASPQDPEVPHATQTVARGGCACHVGPRRSAGTGKLSAWLLLALFMARRRDKVVPAN